MHAKNVEGLDRGDCHSFTLVGFPIKLPDATLQEVTNTPDHQKNHPPKNAHFER